MSFLMATTGTNQSLCLIISLSPNYLLTKLHCFIYIVCPMLVPVFCSVISSQFDNIARFCSVQVKLTMERLKAGWEDTMREREEFSERKIKNLEEQKDKGFHLSFACFSLSLVFHCWLVYLNIRMSCWFCTNWWHHHYVDDGWQMNGFGQFCLL